MIEIRHLRIIDAIARAGTLTEAARRVHLSQPAVSRALAEIETRLGFPLFYREPRGMTPTPECERLLPTAAKTLNMLAEVERDMVRMHDAADVVVRVTTECYTCYHWLPGALMAFGDSYPQVEVQVNADASYQPLQGLIEESVDLAIVHRCSDDDAICYVPLFDDEIVAIMAPDHPLAAKSVLEAQDFADEVLFLHSDPEHTDLLTEVLDPAGVRPCRVTSLQLSEAVLGVVAAGLGVSAVATWVAEPRVREGTLVTRPVAGDALHRSWFAAYRARDSRRAALDALVDAIRGQLTELRLVAASRG